MGCGGVADLACFARTFGGEWETDLGLIGEGRTFFAVAFDFAVDLGLAIAFDAVPDRTKGAADHIGSLLVKAGTKRIAEFAVFEADLDGLAIAVESSATVAAFAYATDTAAWVVAVATVAFKGKNTFYAFVGGWIAGESGVCVAFDGWRLAIRTILPFEIEDASGGAGCVGAKQVGVLVSRTKEGLAGIAVFVFLGELGAYADRGKRVTVVAYAGAFVAAICVGRTNRSVVAAIL